MKKILLFLPCLLFALEPVLVRTYAKTSGPSMISSSNENYIGRIVYGEGNTEFIPIDYFILEDAKREMIYEKQGFGHTLVDIANNGIVVGIDFDGPISGKGLLHFYDRHGIEVNKYSVAFLLERCFSENGEVYCVNDGAKGIIVFHSDGEKLYEVDKANYIAISSDGSILAAAGDSEIDIYKDGEFMVNIPLLSPFIRGISFSEDGSQLLFIDKKNVWFYDTYSGKMIFRYQESKKELSFTSLDISPDGSFLIAGLDFDKGRKTSQRHTYGIVHIFDTQGTIVWSSQVSYNRWNTAIPKVRFTASGSFLIETLDKVQEYNF